MTLARFSRCCAPARLDLVGEAVGQPGQILLLLAQRVLRMLQVLVRLGIVEPGDLVTLMDLGAGRRDRGQGAGRGRHRALFRRTRRARHCRPGWLSLRCGIYAKTASNAFIVVAPSGACGFSEAICAMQRCVQARTMERGEAIAKLKQHEGELRQLGIERLYLFGSTARGEARDDSECRSFFDHPEGSLGFFKLMEVKEAAARILGRKTDIMTRRSLHPVLRERIEASALRIF